MEGGTVYAGFGLREECNKGRVLTLDITVQSRCINSYTLLHRGAIQVVCLQGQFVGRVTQIPF
jgi:hypothetical protein